MSIPDQKIVNEILAPFYQDIDEILKGAFQDWRDISQTILLSYGRTRAVIIHDRAIYRALSILSDKGVIIEEKYETAWFKVEELVGFKFKKGDGLGLSRSFPTPRAIAYHKHYKENLLWPPLHRVEFVYILNDIATEIKKIYVVGRDGYDIAWKIPILGYFAPLYQVPLPFTQASPSTLVEPLHETMPTKKEDKGEE